MYRHAAHHLMYNCWHGGNSKFKEKMRYEFLKGFQMPSLNSAVVCSNS